MPDVKRPGSYVLVLQNRYPAQIEVGKRGAVRTATGFYLYVGSAMGPGGLQARVSRHCRVDKRKHWHIDYVRETMEVTAVWCSDEPVNLEHHWAATLAGLPGIRGIEGLGCSDCNCRSHLFYCRNVPQFAAFMKAAGGGIRPLEGIRK